MANMKTDEIEAAVKAAAKDGKLTCPEARAIAERLQVPYAVVGKTCNAVGIKIKGCSLGCF